MKVFLRKFIFALILGIICCSYRGSYAQDFELLGSDHRIDPDVMLRFSNLNADEMVQQLRALGTKVLILDIHRNLPQIPKVTIGNLPEDGAAVRFYRESVSFSKEILLENAVGIYIPANFHLHETGLYREFDERPFMNSTILLITPEASKTLLMVMYLESYLDSLENFVVRDGSAHHKKCQFRIESYLSSRREDEIRALGPNQRLNRANPEDMRRLEDVVMFVLERRLLALRVNTSWPLRLLDIYRFLFEFSRQLKLNQEESGHFLSSFEAALNVLRGEISTAVEEGNKNISEASRFTGIEGVSAAVRAKYSELIREVEPLATRAEAFTNWFNVTRERTGNRRSY